MSFQNKPVIVITGPTASGKTAISLEIARKLGNVEVICADSTTVYHGLDIGTDKPKTNEILGIPHHLLDIVNPDEEFNVAIFCELANKLIAVIHDRGNIPFIVGGAVLYIDALVYGFEIPEVKPNPSLREKLEAKSAEELYKQLCNYDTECEWTVDKHNKRRLIREIEVFEATGKPLSAQKNRQELPSNVLYLAVNRDRTELYNSIDKRVDAMFLSGLVEEVKSLHRIYEHSTALNSAGYKQVIQCLDGEITLDEAKDKTKQAHRNYAKRQLTWLRKNPDITWIESAQEAESAVVNFLASH